MISILKILSYFILGLMVVVLELRFNKILREDDAWDDEKNKEDPGAYCFYGCLFLLAVLMWPLIFIAQFAYFLGKFIANYMTREKTNDSV